MYQPAGHSSDSDPSEHSFAGAQSVLPHPHRAFAPAPQVAQPMPLRAVPYHVQSEESVTGPPFQFSQPLVPFHEYQALARDREYLLGQISQMQAMRSIEADLDREMRRFRAQVGEMRLRMRVVRTLTATRLHGMTSSSEGQSAVALREMLDYVLQEMEEMEQDPP